MDEHLEAGTRRLTDAVEVGLPEDLGGALRVVIRATIDNHRDNPRLHRVLFEEAPRAPDFLERLHEAERGVIVMATEFLRAHPEVRVTDEGLAARVMVATIEGLVHRLLTAEQPADAQSVEDEIVVLLTGYLRGAVRE